MAGARNFGPRPQFVVDEGMDGMVAHRHAQGRSDPLLNFPVGGEAVGLLQALLELGELVRGQGGSFAGRDVEVQEGRQAALRILGYSAADGIALNAEELGGLGPAARLPTRKQIKQMKALPLAGVVLVLEAGLEFVGGLVDDGHGAVHSTPGTTGGIAAA